MTLHRQLPIAFAVITVAMFAVALIGISHVNRTNGQHISELQHTEDSIVLHRDIALHLRWQVQEWKNFLLRGADPNNFDTYWRSFEHHERQVRVKIQELIGRLEGDATTVAAARRFDTTHRELSAAYRQAREVFDDSGREPTAGDKAVRGIDREPSEQLEAVGASLAQRFDAITERAQETQTQAVRISLGGLLLTMVVGITVGCMINRRITHTFSAECHVAQATMSPFDQDRLNEPATARQDNNASLVLQLAQLQQSLSEGMSDTSGAMNGLRGAFQHSSRQVKQAGDRSETAITAARSSSDAVEKVITTMASINDSSQKIAEITSVIDSIATQTNLLALNASVESARAGEHGKGFAVVAAEVGKLAKNAGTASRQISELVAESVDRVGGGMALVGSANGSMQELLTCVEQVIDIIQGISSSANQQMLSLDRVDAALTHMERTMQQNAALVQECERTA